jgi:hypothetical protein
MIGQEMRRAPCNIYNVSNNIASIEIFKRSLNPIMNGEMFHQKCACHILNLVVKAGLKTEAVKLLIIKFKDALNHIVSSQERKQKFARLCVHYKMSKLKVPWDIDTRWNSTYRMLNRCLPYKAVIGEALRGSIPEGLALELTNGEWEQLERVKEFLKTFFTATVQLSCSYSPTSFELLKHLYNISKVYSELEQAEIHDKSLTPIVDAMKQKFLKYWEDVPLLAVIANCLNPAYKKYYTIKFIERYKDNLHLDKTGVEAYVDSKFNEMFNTYSSRMSGNQNPSSSRAGPSSTSRSTSSGGLLADFQSESQPHTSTNEILSYMAMLNEPEDVDIVGWWRRHARIYPILAMMARDVFAVPVSTVPSESCFSSANRILSDKRSKLGAHVFERLVCLKDWIDAEERTQHLPQQQSSPEANTEESGTEVRHEGEANSDSDGAEESEQWYRNANF